MTEGSNRLPILAGEIKNALADVRRHHQASVTSAIEAGERLIEAKALVGHGQWLPWLQEHCELSARSARDYMRLAEHRDQIGSAASIRAALAAVAKEADPLGATQGWELIEAARAEARVWLAEAEARIADADIPELAGIVATCTEIIEGDIAMRMHAEKRLGQFQATA